MTVLKQFLSLLLIMLSALSFLTCKITENKPVQYPASFDWQGHRGCRGLRPENSIPAFLHGLEYPEVVTLELDLAVSKDGQLIVSHEPWFNPAICRQPGGDSIRSSDAEKFLIHDLTVAQIREFDCGSKGNSRFPNQQKMPVYKPTLREVVDSVRGHYPTRPVRWNMEIKSQPGWDGIRTPPIAEFARLVVDELRAMGLDGQTVVQSFDVRALQEVHRIAPEIRLAQLIEDLKGFDANMASLGFDPAIYSPYYLMVNKALVKKCHDKGIQLIPWTVNDVKSMRRLIRLGVDGIITDYPNLIAEAGTPAPE